MDERDYRAMNKELQEEPKQEALTYTEAAKKEERIFNSTIMSKQETLEEAAENHWRLQYVMSLDETTKPYILEDFKAGAKWVQERMYSEEEVAKLIDRAFKMYACDFRKEAKQFFEENKK